MADFSTEFTSDSIEETIGFGRRIAAALRPNDVLALAGNLGAGKTHLCKGIAAGLGADPDLVNSPTFVILQQYAGALPIFHFDTYRLGDVGEFEDIGGVEILEQGGISLVEWPERIEELLPDRTIRIEIAATAEESRRFVIQGSQRARDVSAACGS